MRVRGPVSFPLLLLLRSLNLAFKCHVMPPKCALMSSFPFRSQFDYDDGLGSSTGRFAIDLYSAEGTGDCGTFMYTLCDKPTIGCKDSSKFFLFFSSLSFCISSLPCHARLDPPPPGCRFCASFLSFVRVRPCVWGSLLLFVTRLVRLTD